MSRYSELRAEQVEALVPVDNFPVPNTGTGGVAVYRRLVYRQTRLTAAILAWHEILLTVPGPVDIPPPVASQAKTTAISRSQ